MELQNLKRWHWVMIGALVGLGLAFGYTRWDSSATAPTIGIRTFQEDLLRQERRAEGDPFIIRNLKLNPPEVIDGKVQWVMTFDYLDFRRRSVARTQTTASEPFRVEIVNNTEFSSNQELPNIRVYLDSVKATNDTFNYRYVWWREPTWAYILWIGGAVVLIGGIWPTLLNLLVGAGLGRPPREPKDEYDLSRFGKGRPDPVVESAISEVDPEALDEVTRAYESNLGELADEAAPAESTPGEDAGLTPVRPLTASPADDPLPPTTAQEEEEKEFAGEFYPVARPVHHKNDDPDPPTEHPSD